MNAQSNAWIRGGGARDDARLRLLCIPYAGGGANVFAAWADAFPAEVEVLRIQLPGRETRFVEPAIDNLRELLPALAAGIEPCLDRPFALFGHSVGALIAFELIRWLRARDQALPRAFYASGHRAPHLPLPRAPVAQLDDARFVEELRWMKGTPAELIGNDELLEIVLPTLRADVNLWETYRYEPGAPLPCAVTVLGGEDDEVTTPAELTPWRDHVAGRFELKLFPGEHFYLHPQQEPLVAYLSADLRRVLAELDQR